MAYVFIYVENCADALETLLYTFRNQMLLGCEKLKLTLKHSDGYSETTSGKVDDVFLSNVIKGIEYLDAIILQHSDGFLKIPTISDEIKSIDGLLEKTKLHNEVCSFNVPLSFRDKSVFFAFKNHPMARYKILGNEIISDKTLSKYGTVLNNVVGKFNLEDGSVTYISTLR